MSEKCPLTLFGEAIGKATVMRGIPIYFGAGMLPMQTGIGRIVLIPTSGELNTPMDCRMTRDLQQTVLAHLWGRDWDDAFMLLRRLLHAVKEARYGGGYLWDARSIDWEDSPDSSKQGQSLTVTLSTTIAIAPVEDTVSVVIQEVDLEVTNQ